MSIFINAKVKFNNIFPAFGHSSFRYYWIAMSISLIGTWMQNIGQSWLVYTLTKSPFLLGLVGTLQFAPMMFFSLFAGAYIDKLPKKKILFFTQSMSGLLALTMALLVWTDYVQYWHILIIATLLGFVNTFDIPTRQTFVVELVGREHLMNAIALNSSVFNAARIIGPALAGILMGYMGIAFCFIINALSFVPLIVVLTYVKVIPLAKKINKESNIFAEIKEGLSYIYRDKLLFGTILSVLVMGIFAMNFSVLIPVFAKDILNQGEKGFGFLMSAMGIGSFAGALLVATRSKTGPRASILFVNSIVVSVLLIVTGITNSFYTTAILLALTGLFSTMFFTTANSTLQINAKDEFRGRMMSVYSLVFGGSSPIGNLLTGSLIGWFGPRAGFITCGGAVIVFVLILSFVKGKSRTDIC